MNLKNAIKKFEVQYTINELRLMNSLISNNKITYNSLLYLDLIKNTENCTVSYLSELLIVAKSSVTLKVKELEKLGLITKKQSEKDKRILYLSVTDSTLEIYDSYYGAVYKFIDEIETTYSETDIQNFCKILGLFTHHYSKEIDKK